MNEQTKPEDRSFAVPAKAGLDSDWQKWVLKMAEKGAGLDASPDAMTSAQREECDRLVSAGRLRKALNHSQDKYGMYIKVSNVQAKPQATAAGDHG